MFFFCSRKNECTHSELYQVNQVLHQFSSLEDHYAKLHNSSRPIYVSIIIQTSIRFECFGCTQLIYAILRERVNILTERYIAYIKLQILTYF